MYVFERAQRDEKKERHCFMIKISNRLISLLPGATPNAILFRARNVCARIIPRA